MLLTNQLSILVPLLLTSTAHALPSHARQAIPIQVRDELLEEYDFIVIGAGTAGLTVADRLSENGENTVLVVEYGFLDTSTSITYVAGPPGAGPDRSEQQYSSLTRLYNVTSVPQEGLNNRPVRAMAGAVVGGSSAVNGMYFNRGSAEDYDSWIWTAGEDHYDEYAEEWGWDNILPYFKKSVTFHPPTEEMVEKYNMTSDIDAAYGGSTPVHSSYPPFQYPSVFSIRDAFAGIPGVEFPTEGADGNAIGVIWVPNSIEPETRTRSYSLPGHYANEGGPSFRQNFHLLPGHRVTQVLLNQPEDDELWYAEGVAITPREGEMPESGAYIVKARKEVVVSAGTLHTPQVLQRSGIGPKDVLVAAEVPVKVELPGVGANLQDHPYFRMDFRFENPPYPSSASLRTNETLRAEALELWETNKTGPYAVYPNNAALLPLSIVSDRTDELVNALLAQDPAAYLPEGTHPTIIAGYAVQQLASARQLLSLRSAVLEVPFSNLGGFNTVLLKQVSRGTVHISPSDDGTTLQGRGAMSPVLDFRAFSNPLDMELCIVMFKFLRDLVRVESFAEAVGPITETNPGEDVVTDEEIATWIRRVITPTDGHLVGTAALGPRELGGVLSPDMTVHGVVGLSVADNSVMPLVPGTHTSSTAYAIGEKAADLVLKRHASPTEEE